MIYTNGRYKIYFTTKDEPNKWAPFCETESLSWAVEDEKIEGTNQGCAKTGTATYSLVTTSKSTISITGKLSDNLVSKELFKKAFQNVDERNNLIVMIKDENNGDADVKFELKSNATISFSSLFGALNEATSLDFDLTLTGTPNIIIEDELIRENASLAAIVEYVS